MAKPLHHKGKREAVETIARKARAGRLASVMKPEMKPMATTIHNVAQTTRGVRVDGGVCAGGEIAINMQNRTKIMGGGVIIA